MSSVRRYNKEEINAIFKEAAANQESARQQIQGMGGLMALDELQEIGRDAGISPEFISSAALSLDRKIQTPPPHKFLGTAVSAARTMQLPERLSDEQWDLLVSDIHEIFQRPGRVQREGSFRQWQNESMQVHLEPIAEGYRLRLQARNELIASGLAGGLAFFLMGLFFMVVLVAKGVFVVDLAKTMILSLFSMAGAGAYGFSAYRLTKWQKDQEAQMDTVIRRVLSRLDTGPSATLGDVGHEASLESNEASAVQVEISDVEHKPNTLRQKNRT